MEVRNNLSESSLVFQKEVTCTVCGEQINPFRNDFTNDLTDARGLNIGVLSDL